MKTVAVELDDEERIVINHHEGYVHVQCEYFSEWQQAWRVDPEAGLVLYRKDLPAFIAALSELP